MNKAKIIERVGPFEVTPELLLKHMRTSDTSELDLVADYIEASYEQLEKRCHITFHPTKYELKLTGFPGCDFEGRRIIELPHPPYMEIEKLSYIDQDGEEVELALDDDYDLDDDGILPVTDWPDSLVKSKRNSVTVAYKAGMAPLPKLLRLAVLNTAAGWFKSRESLSELDFKKLPDAVSIDRLIDSYKEINL